MLPSFCYNFAVDKEDLKLLHYPTESALIATTEGKLLESPNLGDLKENVNIP